MIMYALETVRDNSTGDFILISPDVGFGEQRIRISKEQALILARHIMVVIEDDE